MKHININCLLLAGILSTACQSQAACHYFNDMWDEMDLLMREHQDQMARIKDQMQSLATDADSVKLPKFETVQFPQVTTQVAQDENNVTLKVTLAKKPEAAKPAGNKADNSAQAAKDKANTAQASQDKNTEMVPAEYTLNKDKIDVMPEDNTIEVFIPLAKSFVRINIDSHTYSVIKGVSIKQEHKDDAGSSYSSRSFERWVKSDYLPSLVDIADSKSIKAVVDEKTNTLTITLPKKKKTKIPVTVN